MSTLFLCGAGNCEGVRLAQRVIAADGQWDHLAILDDDPARHGTELIGVPITAPIDELAAAGPSDAAVNLVARDTEIRAAVHARMVSSGIRLAVLVHPGVDPTGCELAPGALVYEQAILSPLTVLGTDSAVLMRGLVGHDAIVGAGCVIAAGAVLNARVVLEDRVYVGSNASILPDVRVGEGATIGCNTMVATDVPPGATVVGVPGQIVVRTTAEAPRPAATPSAGTDPARGRALEASLMEALHGVLGHQRAGPTDHFFDVGGTSLLAIRLVEEIRTRLGHDIPLQQLYARSSMRELAQDLGADSHDTAALKGQQRGAVRRRMANRYSN